MAQKDLSLKALFRHDDVFADVVNGLIFSGESYIQARDPCPVDTV